jgi:hypothetical protein
MDWIRLTLTLGTATFTSAIVVGTLLSLDSQYEVNVLRLQVTATGILCMVAIHLSFKTDAKYASSIDERTTEHGGC